MPNKQIAWELGISPETVKSCLHDIFEKGSIASRFSLVAEAKIQVTPSGKAMAANLPNGLNIPIPNRLNEVLQLVTEGKRYKKISEILGISLETTTSYVSRLFERTSCSSRSELALWNIRRQAYMKEKEKQDNLNKQKVQESQAPILTHIELG